MARKTILEKLANTKGVKYEKELDRALRIMSRRYGERLRIERGKSGMSVESCTPQHICVYMKYTCLSESGKEIMSFVRTIDYSVLYRKKTVNHEFSVPDAHVHLARPYTLWDRLQDWLKQ